jgi:hypothetical protein
MLGAVPLQPLKQKGDCQGAGVKNQADFPETGDFAENTRPSLLEISTPSHLIASPNRLTLFARLPRRRARKSIRFGSAHRVSIDRACGK